MTPIRWSRAVATATLLFAASRTILLMAGLEGMAHLPSGRQLQSANVQRDWQGPRALEMWARWDSEWYLLIAERGYHLERRMAGSRLAYGSADATGFFPLYPILVRGAAAALDRVPFVRRLPVIERGGRKAAPGRRAALLLAGVLVSNAALLGALLLLFERAAEALPPGASNGEGAVFFSMAALLAFPPALFLSAVYPASLLLFLSLLTFRLLRRQRWWAAAACGAFASAAKPAGLLLVIPAFVALLRDGASPRDERRGGARWLSLALYPAGAAAFSLYCARAFGDPLSWYHRQMRWRGAASGPWRAFVRWAHHPVLHGSHGSTVELTFAILALVLLAGAIRRRPPAEWVFAAAVVLLPLCSTVWSFGRLALQAFPLFIVLGGWAERRPKSALVYFLPGIAGGWILMRYYAAWWWAG